MHPYMCLGGSNGAPEPDLTKGLSTIWFQHCLKVNHMELSWILPSKCAEVTSQWGKEL